MPQSTPERMLLTIHHTLHEDDVRLADAWRRTHPVPEVQAGSAQRAASGRLRLAATALAAAVRIPARPRPLAAYAGAPCREGEIEGTLSLIVLSDGRRVLACAAAPATA